MPAHLDEIPSTEVPLDGVLEAAPLLVERRALGRTLVAERGCPPNRGARSPVLSRRTR